MTELTENQKRVLDYMREFFARNDQLPPTRLIQSHFGWKSQTAACNVILQLQKKEVIELNEVGKYRFTRHAKPTP